MAELSPDLIDRLRQRAADRDRRSDAASVSANTLSLENLLGQVGKSSATLSGLLSQFDDLMKGFGVVTPMPVAGGEDGRDPEPQSVVAPADAIKSAEDALGLSLPQDLKQVYCDVGDGGFGPAGGLFPLARLVEEYGEMTSAPAGPQNQPWPANLLPLVDAEPGYDCIDIDTGAMISWDREEIDGYSDAAWKKSFKPLAGSLGEWLEAWLGRPTAAEQMQQQREAAVSDPMAFHIKNLIESYGRMSADERARHGLPEDNWEDAVRQRFGR